jgi:signal transduction histidine kinase
MPRLKGTTVLIVDDDAAMLKALADALLIRMPEIGVETAESGREALERVLRHDFDVIVTDIKMPGMDGLELLARVRELRPDTPTLLITGHGEHDLAVRALRGGAFDFIQKPIDRDYIIASLTRAIRMRHMTRDLERQRLALRRRAVQLEGVVERRTRELREANRAKDEFLAILAHELRNPLAPMRNAAEVMRLRDLGDPVLERARGIIERQVIHMARLVDDLLDVSGITRGKIELRKGVVDVGAVIERSVENARELVTRRGLEIAAKRPLEPLPVVADPIRLEQVVGNLLHNAIKYTEPGGRIAVEAGRDGDEIVIKVQDTGIGIDRSMLDRIFDPFAQAERALERRRGGLGIGLTLVRQLIQMHGGRVTAASEGPGRGSQFTVHLRATREAPDAAPAEGEAAPAGGATRSILIVEDNADSRDSLRQLLEMQGHRVEVAADGLEGLTRAVEMRPELALVDIGLPGMNGYELVERLRAGRENDGIFLVALTGYGSPEDRQRSRQAGFDAHLLKPVDPASLGRILATLAAPAST